MNKIRMAALLALAVGGGLQAQKAVLLSGGAWTDIGALSGDSTSIARSISDSGVIVGVSGSGRAFSYTVGGGFIDLFAATITGPAGAVLPSQTHYGATAINSSGQIAGVARFVYPDGCGTGCVVTTGNHAFLYSGGAIADLDPDPAARASFAFGISDGGVAVGEKHILPRERAYSFDGSLHDLGTLGGWSQMSAVSQDGSIIAGVSQTVLNGGVFHLVKYSSGSLTDLGKPSGGCYMAQFGWMSVNNTGVIAFNDCGLAYYYDGSFHAIPILSGDVSSRATGINASGQICGISYPSHHPFMFTIGGSVVDLGLAKSGGGSYDLVYPTGINAGGDVVGWAK